MVRLSIFQKLPQLTLSLAQDASRLDDRPNSLYPHSRRSYPFDLDDDEEDLASSNVYGAGAGRRTSTASADHGADFAIYEDADDANAYVSPSLRSRLKKTLTSCFR